MTFINFSSSCHCLFLFVIFISISNNIFKIKPLNKCYCFESIRLRILLLFSTSLLRTAIKIELWPSDSQKAVTEDFLQIRRFKWHLSSRIMPHSSSATWSFHQGLFIIWYFFTSFHVIMKRCKKVSSYFFENPEK